MQGLLANHIEQRKAAILSGFNVNIQKSNPDELKKGGVGSGRRRGELVQIGRKIGSYVATYHGKAEKEVGDKHIISRGGERRIVRHDEIFDHPRHAEVNTDEKVAQRVKLYDEDVKKSNGVGSRGGKVKGYTKSGKPVYEHDTDHIHKVGDRVKVHPHLTKDPQNAQGKEGKVTGVTGSTVHVRFNDNSGVGSYSHDALMREKQDDI